MTTAYAETSTPFWPALSRLALKVQSLSGWRGLLLAFVAGLLSAAAFAPVSIVVILVRPS